MGNNFTGPEKTQNNARKYTDAEIKQNIQILFNKNKNNLVESSYSLGTSIEPSSTMNNFVEQENVAAIGGANRNSIKFQSSKNRHLRHDIEGYVRQLQAQYGGQFTEDGNMNINNNDLVEFNKIKDYLLNDLNDEQNEQLGGNMTSDLSNFSFSSEDDDQDVPNNKSLFDVLIGGKLKRNMSTSSLGTTTTLSPSNTSNSLESSYVSSSNSYSETSSTNASASSTFSRTSSATVPEDGSFSPTSYSSSTKNNINTPYIVQSTESSLETSISLNESENATNSQSSELNIVPFYSTESSNKHPYVAKRFRR
jgi:hypothetical protein